tara:strand:- start:1299 stop:1724 length:426 start_codon:yes stop_codon:yes gene_type:complete
MPLKRKPSFKPTESERELVGQMSAVGIPQDSICLVVRDGIDPKTLRKHFRHELDTASVMANSKVAGTLYSKALAGDTTAAIWWTKTRMGWKETSVQESTGNVKIEVVRFAEPNISDTKQLDTPKIATPALGLFGARGETCN